MPRQTPFHREQQQFFTENIVHWHGAPMTLCTSRGVALKSRLMQEILQLGHRKFAGAPFTAERAHWASQQNPHWHDFGARRRQAQDMGQILCYVRLIYNVAVREKMGFVPFHLAHDHGTSAMPDMMLPHKPNDEESDAMDFTQRAEEARQLARLQIGRRQHLNARRYNLCQQGVYFRPGEVVWLWTLILQRGLSKNLLKPHLDPNSMGGQLLPQNCPEWRHETAICLNAAWTGGTNLTAFPLCTASRCWTYIQDTLTHRRPGLRSGTWGPCSSSANPESWNSSRHSSKAVPL